MDELKKQTNKKNTYFDSASYYYFLCYMVFTKIRGMSNEFFFKGETTRPWNPWMSM